MLLEPKLAVRLALTEHYRSRFGAAIMILCNLTLRSIAWSWPTKNNNISSMGAGIAKEIASQVQVRC